VVAVLGLPAGGNGQPAELIDHAAQTLARYKLPKAIVFRAAIERSPAGKADYRWAREQAVNELR
jgi:acyl-CoA synthetase (AMP-forming)/AMP-acid ligase II